MVERYRPEPWDIRRADMKADPKGEYVHISSYEALQKELAEARAERDWANEFRRQHEYCMCGSRMDDHNMGSGHSPVSAYDYHLSQVEERAQAAEARADTLACRVEGLAKPITMQDVRLAVGEGKLRPVDVLNGANAELRRRAALKQKDGGNG